MKTLVLELRDSATFIPILAMRLSSENELERSLLAHGGWGLTNIEHSRYIMLHRMDGNNNVPSRFDPYDWQDRTFSVAHKYIEEHFDELKSGDVIDVEFILGETKTKKVPQ